MQNAAVAQVFDEIADYLEVAGENPFKIRAYRRAAEAVSTHAEPIEDAAEAGTLRSIEGLGEATAAKIAEYLATGKVRFLEKLHDEYPPGLLELLRVPGLGPKRVVQLYRDGGIDSLEALKTALDNDSLNGLSGFGPKALQNVRQGLERMALLSARVPLGDALVLAHSLQSTLAACAAIERLEIAGSLRRGCDSVGDVNLLAQTSDAQSALDAFIALPHVLSLLDRDEKSAAIKIRHGIRATLYCAGADQFAAAWMHATGVPSHLQFARDRAHEIGLALDQNCLQRDGKTLPTPDEAAIYRALGADWIAPELREGRGEWPAALQSTLPALLETRDLKGDLHTHSTWSDGAVSIAQMARAMQARGYAYFAVTDHSKALAMTNGLDATRLREQAQEIARVQAEFPDLRILRGVECDILRDGSLDLDDEILHELDFVIASVHSAFTLDEAAQTARMIRAIRHPAVDLIAHPTGRILGGRPPYAVDVAALIEAARDTDTALEINASERLDLNDVHAFQARQAKVLLSIDSDAHSPRMLPNIELGVAVARRAWCQAKDILNAKPLDDLLKWLNRP